MPLRKQPKAKKKKNQMALGEDIGPASFSFSEVLTPEEFAGRGGCIRPTRLKKMRESQQSCLRVLG